MTMDDSNAMETESHHEREFTNSPWVEMGHFTSPQHSPPMPEYSGFDYGHSTLMAVDSYGMTIPPPYASMPLPMPSHSWPSMLTTQSPFHENGIPPVPAQASVSPSTPAPPGRKASTSSTTPRRTLTDEDRRQMCLYHEENKTAKQTDIGALFGVERSTVSKVLRQKEKYLNPEDGNRSPIKRPRGRIPDIEKALSNWARNYQRQGFSLNDELIKEKAHFFALSCGCPQDGKEKIMSKAWLDKFKQKNSMGAKGRKGARGGSKGPSRINTDSTSDSTLHSPTGHSPLSPPNGFGSPLSPHSQDGVKREPIDGLPELAGGYQHGHSQSTTSLDTTSTAMTSPTSTLVSDSPFTPTSQSRLPASTGKHSRPRSQTLPLVPIDPTLLTADESMDQKYAKTDSQQVAILESPLELGDEEGQATIKGDPTRMIKRNRSNPEINTKSMQPPTTVPTPKSTVQSPIMAPASPTEDEAQRALETVLKYFQRQSSGLAAQDYVTIGKLMERLELAKSQQSPLIGGLARIDEHEDVPRLTKKRSIQNIA